MRQNGLPHRLVTKAKLISCPVSATSTCMITMWPKASSSSSTPLTRMKYHMKRSRPGSAGRGRAAREGLRRIGSPSTGQMRRPWAAIRSRPMERKG